MESAVMLAKLSSLFPTREIERKVARLWDGLFFYRHADSSNSFTKNDQGRERHSIEALQITLELSVVLMHQCLSFEISASVFW